MSAISVVFVADIVDICLCIRSISQVVSLGGFYHVVKLQHQIVGSASTQWNEKKYYREYTVHDAV